MGAGAGYTIYTDNSNIKSLDESTVTPVRLDHYGSSQYPGLIVVVKCDAMVSASVRAESYYHACTWIEGVRIQISEVGIDLDFGNGFNKEILIPEAIEYYKSQYGVDDIEDLYRELIDNVTLEDISREFIVNTIKYGSYDGAGETLSFGYVHSTFDGDFKLIDVDSRNGYNDINYAKMTIISRYVVDYIDEAVTGDNVQYIVCEDNEVVETLNKLGDAIAFSKELAQSYIDKGEPLPEITVERCYYNLYTEDGYSELSDYSEVEYDLTSDPDYADYV